MKNIVAAIDFTPLTEELLQQAAVMARQFKAKLWLIHVAAPDPDFIGYEVGPQYIRDERAKQLREEHRKIQGYTTALKEQEINTEALLIQGVLVKTLYQKAKDLNADLILLGAHSHSALFDKLISDTGRKLVRQSNIPILLVPEKLRK